MLSLAHITFQILENRALRAFVTLLKFPIRSHPAFPKRFRFIINRPRLFLQFLLSFQNWPTWQLKHHAHENESRSYSWYKFNCWYFLFINLICAVKVLIHIWSLWFVLVSHLYFYSYNFLLVIYYYILFWFLANV